MVVVIHDGLEQGSGGERKFLTVCLIQGIANIDLDDHVLLNSARSKVGNVTARTKPCVSAIYTSLALYKSCKPLDCMECTDACAISYFCDCPFSGFSLLCFR